MQEVGEGNYFPFPVWFFLHWAGFPAQFCYYLFWARPSLAQSKEFLCWAGIGPTSLRAEIGPSTLRAEIGPAFVGPRSAQPPCGPRSAQPLWGRDRPDSSWVGFGPFIWTGPTRIFIIYILGIIVYCNIYVCILCIYIFTKKYFEKNLFKKKILLISLNIFLSKWVNVGWYFYTVKIQNQC